MMLLNKSLTEMLMRDVAMAASGGGAVEVVNVFNNLQAENKVELTLTADNEAGTAALSEIFLFPGVGKGATTSLPAGVTLSGGDYATWASWVNYVQNVGIFVDEFWMQSADTGNYSGRLTYGEIMPNGKAPGETYKRLSNYKVSTGNGYAEEIRITDLKLAINPQMFVKFSLKKNTSITIVLTVPMVAMRAGLTPVKF